MPYLVCSPWLYVFSIGERVAKFTKKGGGLNFVPNLQKRGGRGLDEVLTFKGGCWKKRETFFRGDYSFYIQNILQSEIFTEKKSL